MSENFNEQISRFIDDEMSAEESDFFVRRLQRDDGARQQYLRYQLIGAAARGEYLHPGAVDLGRRLERALDEGQPEIINERSSWTHFASGAGIAASVALVAVFGLRLTSLEPDIADSAADLAADLEQPSYVVPESTPEPQEFVRVPAQLTGMQFLIHHARYTSGVSRTLMQSSVIAAQETDPTLAEEQEEEVEPIE